MDPVSIAGAVFAISRAVATVITGFNDIQSRYKRADLAIVAVCSESSAVQAVLSQIADLLTREGDVVISRLQEQQVLASAFDTALTGCMMLYTCLEVELTSLRKVMKRDGRLGWTKKFKALWKQDSISALQGQIRGQVLVLNTLLQGLQTCVCHPSVPQRGAE